MRKKNIQIGPETTKLDFCGQDSHLWKVQYSNFQVKENLTLKLVKKQ